MKRSLLSTGIVIAACAVGLGAAAVVRELRQSDIDTLSELNAIVTDATLIDTDDPRLSNSETAVTAASAASGAGLLWVSGGADRTAVATDAPEVASIGTETLTILDNVDQSHGVSIVIDQDLAANYNLNYRPNGAARTLDMSGNLTVAATASVSGTNTGDYVIARVGSTTSSATPAINTDSTDIYKLTAQAAAITSFTTNLTGTPDDGDQLEIRVLDNGTARAITWGASFGAGPVALPTTTVISKWLRVYFEYDSVRAVWVCMYSGSDV